MFYGADVSLDDGELCLIDSGIESLQNVPLRPCLRSVNLHCNHIRTIEGLQSLASLRHLDLSSNQIRKIQGLDGLRSLRTLNLSCNVIVDVEGLENLRALVKLNLSYNQINNLAGLQAFEGHDYHLSQLDLHGNHVRSADHVTRCLSGCVNLRRLTLSQGGADNPVCHEAGYRGKTLSSLLWLTVLDGCDRSGQKAVTDEILADIPGIEEYMELLASNGSSDINAVDMVTPKIDAALDAFRSRGATTPEISSSVASDRDSSQQPTPRDQPSTSAATKTGQHPMATDTALRLEKLEHMLSDLLHHPSQASGSTTTSPEEKKTRVRQRVTKHMAKRDVDETDESEGDQTSRQKVTDAVSRQSTSRRPLQPSRRAMQSKKMSPSRGRTTKQKKKPTTSGESVELVVRGRSPSPPSRSSTAGVRGGPLPDQGATVVPAGRAPTAVAQDERSREDVQATYVQLMQELESERERRWKAEQATKKLVQHLKDQQSKGREEQELQGVAVQASAHLKQALTNERETRLRLQAQLQLTQEQAKELTEKVSSSQAAREEGDEVLRSLQDTQSKLEREHLHQQAHDAKKVQEAQMRAAASCRELDIVKTQLTTSKGQLQQLQELLAAREQEHRQAVSGRYSLESKELREVINKEVAKAENSHSTEVHQMQQKIGSLSQQYNELEDEFRLALQIESTRFKELQDAFERTSHEAAQNKQALLAAQRKDEKSASVISELTALVKEQKGRITELSRAKQERTMEHKERIQTLEAHLEEARRRMVQLELLKQEKVKLVGQLQAKESLINGLRAEKKIWGEELVSQEAGLAQDRGRMEAKIEALSTEVISLKKQLEREADGVRIKTKMVEDQTETIRKMKEALLERDQEIRKVREESLQVQRDLEDQLTAEVTTNSELQEKMDLMRARKDELKQQINDLQDQLEEAKQAHSALSKKWKEKSSLIGQLEQQVGQMKDTWEAKEKKLTSERDRAIEAASIAVEKLRSMDDAFRKQLDAKQQSQQAVLDRLAQEKQAEVDHANKRVVEVEEEMRELLKETDVNKRTMEDKVKRLNRAFTELQQDLI